MLRTLLAPVLFILLAGTPLFGQAREQLATYEKAFSAIAPEERNKLTAAQDVKAYKDVLEEMIRKRIGENESRKAIVTLLLYAKDMPDDPKGRKKAAASPKGKKTPEIYEGLLAEKLREADYWSEILEGIAKGENYNRSAYVDRLDYSTSFQVEHLDKITVQPYLDYRATKSLRLTGEQKTNYDEDTAFLVKRIQRARFRVLRKELDNLRKQGMALIKCHVRGGESYSSSCGLAFKAFNLASKPIKYVWVTVTGLNRVGDPIGGGRFTSATSTLKGIGPVQPDQIMTFLWERVWFTDLVESCRIQSIKVQYMDGSTRMMNGVKGLQLSSMAISILDEMGEE